MDFSNIDMALSTISAYDASSSVSSASLAYAVSTEILSQSIDMTEVMGTSMIQMMERSVTPELGGNIDIYIQLEIFPIWKKRGVTADAVTPF